MIYLTRKCEFSASHYYHNPELSPEENRRLYGKCANLNGHGHNYTLEVTVRGEVDPTTGFVIDLKELKDIMNREVVETLDHRHLNKEIAEFAQCKSHHRKYRRLHLAAARTESENRKTTPRAGL